MADYPSNSFRSKEQAAENVEKRAEKIVKGEIKTKKKSLGEKLIDTFIAEDISTVRKHVFTDVVVPKIIDIIISGVTEGLTRLFRGGGSVRQYNSNSQYYNKPSSVYHAASNNVQTNTQDTYSRSVYSYADIIYESQMDAENVLTDLISEIDVYGSVSVAHLYEIIGRDTNPIDYKYGWKSLSSARSERITDGYILKLPRAIPL